MLYWCNRTNVRKKLRRTSTCLISPACSVALLSIRKDFLLRGKAGKRYLISGNHSLSQPHQGDVVLDRGDGGILEALVAIDA